MDLLEEENGLPGLGNEGRDALNKSLLEMKIQSLEKYKTNYTMLCSQLGELNEQVGIQLLQHEGDVKTLKERITILEKANSLLKTKLSESEANGKAQVSIAQQDRVYADEMHQQLEATAKLLNERECDLAEKEEAKTKLINELKESNRKLYLELENMTGKQEEYSALQATVHSLENLKQTDAHMIDKLQKMIRKQRKQLKEQNFGIQSLEQHSEACRKQYDQVCQQAQAQVLDSSSHIEKLRKDKKKLIQQIEEYRVKETKRKADNNAQVVTLTEQVRGLTESEARYEAQIKQLQTELTEVKTKYSTKEKEMTEKNERIVHLEQGIQKLEKMVDRRNKFQFKELDHKSSSDCTCSTTAVPVPPVRVSSRSSMLLEDKLQKRVDTLEQKFTDATEKLQHLQLQLLNNESESINSRQEVHILTTEIDFLKKSLEQMSGEHQVRMSQSEAVTQARQQLRADREALKKAINSQMKSSSSSSSTIRGKKKALVRTTSKVSS